VEGESQETARTLNRWTGSVRRGREDFEPRAQVEGTLTGEVGPRCQLTHRPQREGFSGAAGLDPAALRPPPGRACFTSSLRIGYLKLTANGHSQSMLRRASTLAVVAVLAFSGTALAGSGRGPVPQFPRLPGTWSHAEINVSIKRVPHTLILDRGKIVQVNATQVTIRRRDDTLVVVPLSQSTIVVVDSVPATVFDLRKRMNIQTMRIDGGAAVRVRASSF
jgi:hypothetical protein